MVNTSERAISSYLCSYLFLQPHKRKRKRKQQLKALVDLLHLDFRSLMDSKQRYQQCQTRWSSSLLLLCLCLSTNLSLGL